jgi:hypothetical protein
MVPKTRFGIWDVLSFLLGKGHNEEGGGRRRAVKGSSGSVGGRRDKWVRVRGLCSCRMA